MAEEVLRSVTLSKSTKNVQITLLRVDSKFRLHKIAKVFHVHQNVLQVPKTLVLIMQRDPFIFIYITLLDYN